MIQVNLHIPSANVGPLQIGGKRTLNLIGHALQLRASNFKILAQQVHVTRVGFLEGSNLFLHGALFHFRCEDIWVVPAFIFGQRAPLNDICSLQKGLGGGLVPPFNAMPSWENVDEAQECIFQLAAQHVLAKFVEPPYRCVPTGSYSGGGGGSGSGSSSSSSSSSRSRSSSSSSSRGARVGVALVVAIVVVVVVVAVVVVVVVVGKGAAPPPQCKQSLDSSFVGDQMRFAICLLGCMVQIEKREGGTGEGAAPPLQCKQSLDSSFVLTTQVFLRGRVLIATETGVIPNSSVIPTCLVCFLRLSKPILASRCFLRPS